MGPLHSPPPPRSQDPSGLPGNSPNAPRLPETRCSAGGHLVCRRPVGCGQSPGQPTIVVLSVVVSASSWPQSTGSSRFATACHSVLSATGSRTVLACSRRSTRRWDDLALAAPRPTLQGRPMAGSAPRAPSQHLARAPRDSRDEQNRLLDEDGINPCAAKHRSKDHRRVDPYSSPLSPLRSTGTPPRRPAAGPSATAMTCSKPSTELVPMMGFSQGSPQWRCRS